MAEKRHYLPNKERNRHLAQYKDMSDDEFDVYWEKRQLEFEPSEQLETRIKQKLEEFANDYDLDDLKINDTLILRELIQAIIALEDLEQRMFNLRTEGISGDNMVLMEKIGKEMSSLRGDISSFQNDLKITRKIRKSEQETSVLNYLEDLKAKAKEYYQQKMMYILCPKCNMLLATIWTLYPDKHNKVELTCNRTLDDGSKCGEKVVVYTDEMLNNKGSNKPEQLPESIL